MRLMLIPWIFVLGFAFSFEEAQATILTDYPNLERLIYKEPDTHIRMGFGVSPLRIMKSKAGLAINIFQIHWAYRNLDWEIFSASFGTTLSSDPNTKVNAFTFRTVPKYKVNEMFSIGPVVGLEYVSFPDVQARIGKDNWYTPVEPYSSRGLIYGIDFSESVPFNSKFTLKLNQMIYKQTYSTVGTRDGWTYLYQGSSSGLNDDPGPISPGIVFLMEFNLLY